MLNRGRIMTDSAEKTERRHAVTVGGATDGQPVMFAHGYGCNQNMWRLVTPA